MRINASKTKVMSGLIRAVLLDGELLEHVDKFKYLDSRAGQRSDQEHG